jgi:DNA-directed RNA polymerase I subunit RPA12
MLEWPFCPNCGATLKADSSGCIECVVCKFSSHLSQFAETDQLPSITTYSSTRPVPLWAKSDEEQAALRAAKDPQRATIEEPCIKCGAKEVGFYTLQLRSVDEGSTVFYECPECDHTWSVNN